MIRSWARPLTQDHPACTASAVSWNGPAALVESIHRRKLAAKWNDLGLAPSAPCSDEGSSPADARRLGTMPTPRRCAISWPTPPGQARQPSSASSSRPEFVDFWALKWGDLLRINRDLLNEKGMVELLQLGAGRPARQQAESMRWSATSSPPRAAPSPRGRRTSTCCSYRRTDWSETTTQLFWASASSAPAAITIPSRNGPRTITTAWPRSSSGWGPRTARNSASSAAKRSSISGRPASDPSAQRRHGQAASARRPDMDDPFDRRRKLAEWLTAKENPFFARNMVNRFWSYTMGRGLVEPSRRHGHQSRQQSGAARRTGGRLRQEQVRPQAPAADHLPLAGLSAELQATPWQRGRRRPTSIHTRYR